VDEAGVEGVNKRLIVKRRFLLGNFKIIQTACGSWTQKVATNKKQAKVYSCGLLPGRLAQFKRLLMNCFSGGRAMKMMDQIRVSLEKI
jgi:hypothetical protein